MGLGLRSFSSLVTVQYHQISFRHCYDAAQDAEATDKPVLDMDSILCSSYWAPDHSIAFTAVSVDGLAYQLIKAIK